MINSSLRHWRHLRTIHTWNQLWPTHGFFLSIPFSPLAVIHLCPIRIGYMEFQSNVFLLGYVSSERYQTLFHSPENSPFFRHNSSFPRGWKISLRSVGGPLIGWVKLLSKIAVTQLLDQTHTGKSGTEVHIVPGSWKGVSSLTAELQRRFDLCLHGVHTFEDLTRKKTPLQELIRQHATPGRE